MALFVTDRARDARKQQGDQESRRNEEGRGVDRERGGYSCQADDCRAECGTAHSPEVRADAGQRVGAGQILIWDNLRDDG